jgi:CBS domain-containing protein
MKLQDIMITEVIQAAPEENVAAAAKRMHERRVGCLVVTRDGAVKGIVTDRDLLACLAEGHDPYRCQLATHMHRPVFVLRPDESPAEAAEVMQARRIKRLPVAKDGRLLGIVSLSDLAALASREAEQLRPALRFFTDVVRSQSSQHELPVASTGQAQAGTELTAANDDNRLEALNAGGPG